MTVSPLSVDSDALLFRITSSTTGDMYTGSGYTMEESSLGPYGIRFSIASKISVSAFEGYRTSGMPTSRTFRLWNSSGTKLAEVSTSSETSASLEPGDIVISGNS